VGNVVVIVFSPSSSALGLFWPCGVCGMGSPMGSEAVLLFPAQQMVPRPHRPAIGVLRSQRKPACVRDLRAAVAELPGNGSTESLEARIFKDMTYRDVR
jgi:hypothetical protein